LGLAGAGESRGAAALARAAAAAAPPAGLPCRRRQRSAAPPGAPSAGAPGPACQPRAGPGRSPAPLHLCEYEVEPECCAYAGISGRKGANLQRPAKMIGQSWQGAGCAPAGPAPAAGAGAPGRPWLRRCPGCTPWHAGEGSPRGNISGRTVGVTIMQAPDTARKQIRCTRTPPGEHPAWDLWHSVQRAGRGRAWRCLRPIRPPAPAPAAGREEFDADCLLPVAQQGRRIGSSMPAQSPRALCPATTGPQGRAHLADCSEQLAPVGVGVAAHAHQRSGKERMAHRAPHGSHSTPLEQQSRTPHRQDVCA